MLKTTRSKEGKQTEPSKTLVPIIKKERISAADVPIQRVFIPAGLKKIPDARNKRKPVRQSEFKTLVQFGIVRRVRITAAQAHQTLPLKA